MRMVSLLALLMAVSPLSALTGVGSSGGGGAFVCIENGVAKAELLDLWESDHVEDYPTTRSNEGYLAQIEFYLNKLKSANPALGAETELAMNYILENTEEVPPDLELLPPPDANPVFRKPGCELKGMMYYNGRVEKLWVDHEVFDALEDQTNIAAAYMHEAVYKALRGSIRGGGNSVMARKIVGRLFSTKSNRVPIEIPSSGVRICENSNIQFYLFEQNGAEKILFKKVLGHQLTNGTLVPEFYCGVNVQEDWLEEIDAPAYYLYGDSMDCQSEHGGKYFDYAENQVRYAVTDIESYPCKDLR